MEGGGGEGEGEVNRPQKISVALYQCDFLTLLRQLKPEFQNQQQQLNLDEISKTYKAVWNDFCEMVVTSPEVNPVVRQEMHQRVFQLFLPVGFESAHAHTHVEVHTPMTIGELAIKEDIFSFCQYLCSVEPQRVLLGLDNPEWLSPRDESEKILENLVPEIPDSINNQHPLFLRACILIFLVYINKMASMQGMSFLWFFEENIDMNSRIDEYIEKPRPGKVIFHLNRFYFIDRELRLIQIMDTDPKRIMYILLLMWVSVGGRTAEIIKKTFGFVLK